MSRRHYLVSYDIADDKRRTRVFEAIKDQGDHAQFSVFFCELNDREKVALQATLQPLIHDRDDQVFLIDLGPAHHALEEGLICLGKPYNPSTRTTIV